MSSIRWRFAGVALALVMAGWSVDPLAAQIKLRVVEDPKVGREAPDFTAAYLTAAGPGPVAQPFHLGAELGHTVVLVFATSPQSEELKRQLQGLAAIRDSLFRPGVVVVGALKSDAQAAQDLATGLSFPFKLLPDSLGVVFRAYGVVGRQSRERWAVFVVDPEGRLKYRTREFAVTDPGQVAALKAGLR